MALADWTKVPPEDSLALVLKGARADMLVAKPVMVRSGPTTSGL
jgi:hypothetical protein